MTKPKQIKKNYDISPEPLVELQRATLIASTGSSMRLADSRVTNEEVERVLNEISKPSGQKQARQTN